SLARSLNKLIDSSDDQKLLALVDVRGFDPEEVTVTVKDGKVKVSAEHKEEQTTPEGRDYSYRMIVKEINLPQGLSEDEVTHSL
ncbi:ODFP1 protein, partial [Centropus bengalensis]|nr:ODFP1 protein [Centropus bengalensis]